MQNLELQTIVQKCEARTTAHNIVKDGLLYFKNIPRITSNSPLKTVIFQEFHNSPIGGHAGMLKTFMRIFSNFYWPGLREDVRHYVGKCYVCQHIKSPTSKDVGLL